MVFKMAEIITDDNKTSRMETILKLADRLTTVITGFWVLTGAVAMTDVSFLDASVGAKMFEQLTIPVCSTAFGTIIAHIVGRKQ